jgi:hypothetical protein
MSGDMLAVLFVGPGGNPHKSGLIRLLAVNASATSRAILADLV